MAKDVNGDTFSFQGWAGPGSGLDMPLKEVMHGIGTQRCPAEVGKHNLPIAADKLAKPGFQYSHCGFCEWDAPLFSTFSNHANMSAWPEGEIVVCQATHFRLTQPGLGRDQKKCVIAPPEPRVLIRGGQQSLNFLAGEKVHLGPCEAFGGNGQYALDLGGMIRHLERSIAKEGVDGSEAQVATAYTQFPVFLKVIEKTNDQRRINGLQYKSSRGRVQLLIRKFKQHPKGVAVRTDGMRTRLSLLHQALGEKPFQQWREADRRGGHDWPSQQCSRRAIACCINSGHALRYQKVSLTWT